ncbi:MAG TPA: copper-binding protein [Limnobacter sp.]|uniref:copper-binding protein n=1 Tax=Limnobacter sp. TaxID=2003368 RepID=UPI002E37B045|nr:copper-binding protein [Limnobacter sp.]HEX5484732.1 copper-binding protein [Limnobacter sp.]
MKLTTLTKPLLVASFLGLSAIAHAADPNAEVVQGEVKNVLADQGKVTLKHGLIKSMKMPPMTMNYKVKDPAMLKDLQKGDHVEFQLDSDMVIEDIHKK